jgi:hypothetical protein
MGEGTSWVTRLLSWFILAVVAIIALKLAAWVAGAALSLVIFLLFTVVPLVVVGWLIVKLVRVFRRGDDYRPA